MSLNYVTARHEGRVALYIDRGETAPNKEIFDRLHAEREQIEQVFAGPLIWERLADKRASRIKYTIQDGGYRDDEQRWPEIQEEMIDAMIRFEKALRPHLEKL